MTWRGMRQRRTMTAAHEAAAREAAAHEAGVAGDDVSAETNGNRQANGHENGNENGHAVANSIAKINGVDHAITDIFAETNGTGRAVSGCFRGNTRRSRRGTTDRRTDGRAPQFVYAPRRRAAAHG